MTPGRFSPVAVPSRGRSKPSQAVRGIRERWPLVPGFALGLALAGVWAASLVPERYRGQTLVRVEWAEDVRRAEASGADHERGVLWEGLLDRGRLERLLQEMPAVRSPAAGALADDIDAVVARLDLAPGTGGAFWVRFAHPNRELAVVVPNLLVSLLVEDTERASAGLETPAPASAQAELVEARKAVERKEAAVLRVRERRFRAQSDIPAPESDRLRSERRSLTASLAAAEDKAARLRRTGEGARGSRGTTTGRTASELERLRVQLADLRLRYTEQHPDVEALRRRIQEMEARAQGPDTPEPGSSAAPQPGLAEVEREIQTLRERIARIDMLVAAPPPDGRSRSPHSSAELAAAEKELAQAREDYAAALREWEREEQTRALGAGATVRYTLLERARSPRPVGPGALVLALVGAAVGLVLGVSTAVFAESRDDRIKGPEDVEKVLGKPLLAAIPDGTKSRLWPRIGR